VSQGSLEDAVRRPPGHHRHVPERRYGLGDRGTATLAQLSTELGVCKEQVRRLQQEAERVLRTGVKLQTKRAP
jgi:DNA-directed RNA polymerase sigma subunit (sigma70/sigma32)